MGLTGDQAQLCAQQIPGGCGLPGGCYQLPEWDDQAMLVVSVKFHIVYQPGGLPPGTPCTTPPTQAQLTEMLQELNRVVSPANVYFVQLGAIDAFEDQALHRIDCEAELATLLVHSNEPNAVDVYWVDKLSPAPAGPFGCLTSNLCFSQNGWGSKTVTSVGQGVVLRSCGPTEFNACECPSSLSAPCSECTIECGAYRDRIFVHEMGHYFDLDHPHETTYGVECTGLDESNCSTCGDFLCDTHAEPAPGEYEVGENCSAINLPPPTCGNAPYQIDLTNYMNQKAEGIPCRNHLTRGQLKRMRATLLNLRAGELL